MLKLNIIKKSIILLITALLLLVLLYLITFPYIVPSYKQADHIKIDITSWNSDNDIHTIENYFIEFKNYVSHVTNFKDKNGILFRNPYADTKKYVMKPGIDSLYIATDMSMAIIREFSNFVSSNDSSHLYIILKYSDWLKKNVVIENNFASWPYPFKFTKYDLDYDWCGAWALGNILSAISRSIVVSEDSAFVKLADQIVRTFSTKIEDGGILFIDKDQNYWYEEYPTIPPSHVLNGHITGLLGLYDYWRISDNPDAKTLFEKGIETVRANLDRFDSGYWSLYDVKYPYVGDYFYHKAVHLPQLRILFQITEDKFYLDYAEKWEEYFNEPYFSIFKLKMIIDGIHRRLTYKSFFTLGK